MEKMKIIVPVVVIVLIIGAVAGYFLFYADDEEEMFELTINTEGDGSVDVDPDQDEYEDGTEVSLTAEPEDDWEFDEWDGTDETGAEITITMDEDKEITAHFEEDTVEPGEYELTINIEGQGTTNPSEGTHIYDEDEDVNVEAIPADGWEFNEWTGDASGTDNQTTITMDEDKEITANFDTDKTTYELTVNIDGEGTVEVDGDEFDHGDSDTFIENDDVDLVAIPDDGWEFDEWDGTDETGDSITITMDEDKTITAYFIAEEEEEGDTWNAYDFESEIDIEGEAIQSFLAANDDENKTLQEFTYDHTFVDEDGQHMNFTIETTYKGISDTEITVIRYDLSDPMNPEETKETDTIQTYELEHTIYVDIEGDETHPDEIYMTVHIPVGNFSTEEVETPAGYDDYSNFWIYSKVEFTDTNDNEGLFSYHLTDDWEDEHEEDNDIYYVPYTEDDFDDTDYDEWVLYGVYGHCWSWFQPFDEDHGLEERDYDLHGYTFSVEEDTFDISEYTLEGFTIKCEDITFGEEDLHLEGSFVPSLPIPVYLRAGQEDGETSYTMELTDIELG